MHQKGLLAISPIIVFLISYVAVSVTIGDFYKMPLAVALLIASAWAILTTRGHKLSHKINIFSREAAQPNIMYMVWIFILAGAFAQLAKEIGAVDATVNLTLQHLPHKMLIPGLFFAACFISLSIGTSVGTVVALTPLAVELAQSSGGETAFFIATVLGGAFFGDNLSFISDTTIAATRTQGCKMNDKFKANLWIALPAAIVTLGIYTIIGLNSTSISTSATTNPWLIIPYLIVIGTALAGINVTIVLTGGIVSALIIAVADGHSLLDLFSFMGNGIDSMGNLVIITLLAAGMLGLIKENGGINYILKLLTSRINGTRGAQAAISLLVSIVNLCTANNTVSIITVGSLSKDISERYGIDPRKSASLLDTCSCIVQCLIPYGAQTLLATSLAGISPVSPWAYLYYPWALSIMVIISIAFRYPRYLRTDKRD